jgi:hypothetical protein
VGELTTNPSDAGDLCQLFNDPYYSGIYPYVGTALSVHFQVNCVKPALPTTGGSVLYLQYANYTFSDVPPVWENVSNWKILGSTIYIDNTLNWPCPGVLVNTIAGFLPAIGSGTVNAYQFRVVGVCSCNATTPNAGNPILNNVQVNLLVQSKAPYAIQATGFTTAHFLWLPIAPTSLGTATTVTIGWIASDGTTVQVGTSSCTIPVASDRCTTQTVNFGIAFAGTPVVTTQIKLNPQISVTSVGSITLFSTHHIQA